MSTTNPSVLPRQIIARRHFGLPPAANAVEPPGT
jgi:hypothetical protein